MLSPILILAAILAAAGAAPVSKAEGGRIVHPRERLTVTVPPVARHIGSERFTLYDVADAEVHVFVEGDGKEIRRLYWVQFESYLPARPELSYNYADGNRRGALGGVTTWMRAGPVATGGPMRAGSDREHVFNILKRAGYTIPPAVMNLRMVQLFDDPQGTGRGRRELMIIYSENLALSGKTLAELVTDGKPNANWAAIEPELVKRATSSVSVTRD